MIERKLPLKEIKRGKGEVTTLGETIALSISRRSTYGMKKISDARVETKGTTGGGKSLEKNLL